MAAAAYAALFAALAAYDAARPFGLSLTYLEISRIVAYSAAS